MHPHSMQLRTPSLPGGSKRVGLRTPEDLVRLCGVRLSFSDGSDSDLSPTPVRALDFEFVLPALDRMTPVSSPTTPRKSRLKSGPVPVTPQSGGTTCLNSLLTPDPIAFNEGGDKLQLKTPRRRRPLSLGVRTVYMNSPFSSDTLRSPSTHIAGYPPDTPPYDYDSWDYLSSRDSTPPQCPETPLVPIPIERHASLWSAKALDTLNDLDFYRHSPFSLMVDFDQVECIGRGMFFDVYRARNIADDRAYAIKRSRKPFRGVADREGYLREVKALKILAHHPHIVAYSRAWQESGHFVVQMELCVASLSDLLSGLLGAGRTFDPGFIADIISQIAHGLAHVHAHNVLHMDIKPDNVLVTVDGTLKLADFGQSIILGSDKFEGSESEGDCRYVSPELLLDAQPSSSPEDASFTAAADIFALGLLAFELATQFDLPSAGPQWRQLRDGSTPLVYLLNSQVPQHLAILIQSMLNPRFDLRPNASQICAIVSRMSRSFGFPNMGELCKQRQSRTPV